MFSFKSKSKSLRTLFKHRSLGSLDLSSRTRTEFVAELILPILLALSFLATPSTIFAQRDFTPGTEVINEVPTIQGFEAVFENIITVVLAFGALVVFIMLLSGGFKFLTSGGDGKKVEAAKGTLTYAIGGLALLALTYLILVFIQTFFIDPSSGIDITKFRIIPNF